jgi:hypothetical protein
MKELLIEMMQNSADVGQPVWDWRPDLVADEILAYVDDFAETDYDEMVATIREIQEERK